MSKDVISLAPLQAVNEIASDIYISLKSIAKNGLLEVLSNLKYGFDGYRLQKYSEISKVKTFLSPLSPVDINDVFVDPKFTIYKWTFDYEYLPKYVKENRIVVISGTAGQGKTSIARHYFCRMCLENEDIIPVFIDLRSFNEPGFDIVNYGTEQFRAHSPDFSKIYFECLLKNGAIHFVLDGFDEIGPDRRDEAIASISSISLKYPKTLILVTSRPNLAFRSMQRAYEIAIESFSDLEVVNMVNKSPVDIYVKSSFIKKLRESYFDLYGDLVHNPLLLNIMILTFLRDGSIPDTKHLFFRRSFDVLLRDHDNMKFLFDRTFHSALAEERFERVWATFCFISSRVPLYDFTEGQLRSCLIKSILYCEENVSVDSFVNDLTESVCMIFRDGDKYTFIHRSFQEYFSASFLRNEEIENKTSYIEYFLNIENDETLRFLYLMDREYLNFIYIGPEIEKYLKSLPNFNDVRGRILWAFGDVLARRPQLKLRSGALPEVRMKDHLQGSEHLQRLKEIGPSYIGEMSPQFFSAGRQALGHDIPYEAHFVERLMRIGALKFPSTLEVEISRHFYDASKKDVLARQNVIQLSDLFFANASEQLDGLNDCATLMVDILRDKLSEINQRTKEKSTVLDERLSLN